MRHLTTQLGLICASLMLSASGAWALPKCPDDPNAYRSNCVGTYTYANGYIYVGEFKDDNLHGQGTFTTANGNRYVGRWLDSKMHGQGVLILANGTVQEGVFKNGVFQYAQKTPYSSKPSCVAGTHPTTIKSALMLKTPPFVISPTFPINRHSSSGLPTDVKVA